MGGAVQKIQWRLPQIDPSSPTVLASCQRTTGAALHCHRIWRSVLIVLSFSAISLIASSTNNINNRRTWSLLVPQTRQRRHHLAKEIIQVPCNTLCLSSTRKRRKSKFPTTTVSDFCSSDVDESSSTMSYPSKRLQRNSAVVATYKNHEKLELLSSRRKQKILDYSTNTGRSQKHPKKLLLNNTVSNNHETQTTQNLVFWENMVCGAVSRSVAQVAVHPMNTMKTILQHNRNAASSNNNFQKVTFRTLARPSNWRLLTRGAGTQLLFSLPHGAINYAVLEFVRSHMNNFVEQLMKSQENAGDGSSRQKERFSAIKPLVATVTGPGLDFFSSCISTVCTSVIAAPQSMITDSIMAGVYPNLPSACVGIMKQGKGIRGFYAGMWPSLVGKIPSYALTETVFEQLKRTHQTALHRPPTDIENSIMGCIAAVTAVFVMLPMDTIKTRINTSSSAGMDPYKGIIDAAWRIAHEEGYATFYKGMTPRLISVVPMIGIQFGLKEYMKKIMLQMKQPCNVDHLSPPQPCSKPWSSLTSFS